MNNNGTGGGVGGSHSKFESTEGRVHKEYFMMDNFVDRAQDLEQSERSGAGQNYPTGRSSMRQPHTTRSMSSI